MWDKADHCSENEILDRGHPETLPMISDWWYPPSCLLQTGSLQRIRLCEKLQLEARKQVQKSQVMFWPAPFSTSLLFRVYSTRKHADVICQNAILMTAWNWIYHTWFQCCQRTSFVSKAVPTFVPRCAIFLTCSIFQANNLLREMRVVTAHVFPSLSPSLSLSPLLNFNL